MGRTGAGSFLLLLAMAAGSTALAQPAPAAKEERKAQRMDEKRTRPPSVGQEQAQQEARGQADRKMNRAQTDLHSGVASGTGSMSGGTRGAPPGSGKPPAATVAPDARKPVPPPISGKSR